MNANIKLRVQHESLTALCRKVPINFYIFSLTHHFFGANQINLATGNDFTTATITATKSADIEH
jgi:hypothetical protein